MIDDCTCPLCGGPIPDGDIKIDTEMRAVLGHGRIAVLSNLEWEIFKALWKASGPLPTERLFNMLYADREDGGPEHNQVAVVAMKLRRKISRLGLDVQSIRDTGYFIKRKGQDNETGR